MGACNAMRRLDALSGLEGNGNGWRDRSVISSTCFLCRLLVLGKQSAISRACQSTSQPPSAKIRATCMQTSRRKKQSHGSSCVRSATCVAT
mmetsp:Transcript_25425/g.51789  ORF Transcript_25425/g.51789 Transcript_25425/m.51789 type:complete len:91 (-) Transcript_25425:735-1007(-)